MAQLLSLLNKRPSGDKADSKMESKEAFVQNLNDLEKEKKKKKKKSKKKSDDQDDGSVVSVEDEATKPSSNLSVMSINSRRSSETRSIKAPKKSKKKRSGKTSLSPKNSPKNSPKKSVPDLDSHVADKEKKKKKKNTDEKTSVSADSLQSGNTVGGNKAAKEKMKKKKKKSDKEAHSVKKVITQRNAVIVRAARREEKRSKIRIIGKRLDSARNLLEKVAQGSAELKPGTQKAAVSVPENSKKQEKRLSIKKAEKLASVSKKEKETEDSLSELKEREPGPRASGPSRGVTGASSFQRKANLFGGRNSDAPKTPGQHFGFMFQKGGDDKQKEKPHEKKETRRSRSLGPLIEKKSTATVKEEESSADKPTYGARQSRRRSSKGSRAAPGFDAYTNVLKSERKKTQENDNSAEKTVERRGRSGSPGRFRQAYLQQVSSLDDEGEETHKDEVGRKGLANSGTMRQRSNSVGPSDYQKAYLKSVGSNDDIEEVPLNDGAPQGRKRPTLDKPRSLKRKSKSTSSPKSVPGSPDSGGVMQYLGFGVKRTGSLGSLSPSRPKADVIATSAKERLSARESRRESRGSQRGSRSGARTLSPRAGKRTLNALNLATPSAKAKGIAPRPKNLKKLLTQEASSFAESVVGLLKNKSKKGKVTKLCDRIEDADGLPKARRLSMRDNDLICDIINAIQNDPTVTEIVVDQDTVFNTVSTTLLFQFISALQINFHVKKLVLRGVQLGNDILYALASSMETNFAIEEIDLSLNCFTSEGLAEFCQVLGRSNQTVKSINVENQTTPISVASEADVLEAFEGNKVLRNVQVDFNSKDGKEKLEKILSCNKKRSPPKRDFDKMLMELLEYEADRAESLMEQRKAENAVLEVPEDDWEYLYELATLFDKYKLKEIVESENEEASSASKLKNADSLSKAEKSNFLFGQFKDILDDSIGCFNSDGSFLTAEFISKYLKKTQDTEEMVFDFHGQWKLFKRFPVTDPDRELIVTKFVDAIVNHPQMKEFMGINMANTGCGDDFLEKLAERCLADPKLLPNMHMLNFETNFVNERGCVALSKLIASPTSMRYLQLVRLENQKGLLTSRAEFALAKAMFVNRSVVVVSLRFRNLLERQQIHSYVCRNVDFLRQARQRHYKKTGTGRARNEMEVFFDKIAANDRSITEVNLVGNRKFLSLSKEETVKAAKAFAKNTRVNTINLNSCELDDEFAEAMGKSLETNKTIEKLQLENNFISGEGIRFIFEGVANNSKSCLSELRLHKQSKAIAAADEDALADILEPNTSLFKLGIDLRQQNAQVKIDRFLKLNDRKKRRDSADGANYLFG